MKQDPKEIGLEIADAGALLHGTDEFKAIANLATRVIRAERKGAIFLTKAEAKAALDAIGQMTGGNTYDFCEWKSQTSGTMRQWLALLRAETKIASALQATTDRGAS